LSFFVSKKYKMEFIIKKLKNISNNAKVIKN
jgi:hypothetical protein